MKKLNKLFLAAGSVAAIAAPVAAVVSCGNPVNAKYTFNDARTQSVQITGAHEGTEVAFVTDGGFINDKSFNEEGVNGVKLFSSKNPTLGYKVIQVDGSKDTTAFKTAYGNASQAQDVVLSGFLHDNPSGNKGDSKHEAALNGKHIVAIDIEDTDHSNTYYGVTFKTQQSGFLAAVEAGYMLNEQFKTENSTAAIPVATFGGVAIKAVTDYMNGFVAGIKWFNDNNGQLRDLVQVHASGNEVSKDFSNSFDAGQGTAIAQTLLNKGARAIFPVAGIESADVDQVIRKNRKQSEVFLIGVDVDQSATFGGTVLVSAIKGIREATVDMLERIHNLNNKSTPQDIEYNLGNGAGFVGAIANANYAKGFDDKQLADATAAAQVDSNFADVYTLPATKSSN